MGLQMPIRNYSSASIAEVFVISANTVRTHVKHIYAKLDMHKRQELIDMVDKRDVRQGERGMRLGSEIVQANHRSQAGLSGDCCSGSIRDDYLLERLFLQKK